MKLNIPSKNKTIEFIDCKNALNEFCYQGCYLNRYKTEKFNLGILWTQTIVHGSYRIVVSEKPSHEN